MAAVGTFGAIAADGRRMSSVIDSAAKDWTTSYVAVTSVMTTI